MLEDVARDDKVLTGVGQNRKKVDVQIADDVGPREHGLATKLREQNSIVCRLPAIEVMDDQPLRKGKGSMACTDLKSFAVKPSCEALASVKAEGPATAHPKASDDFYGS